jgi:hypothetical protein
MSFIDSAAEVIDRAEASLNSLLGDALKAKAYRDVAAIAALAEAVRAIPGRSCEGRKSGPAADLGMDVSTPVPAEAAKPSEPSWMRPKS